MSNESQHTGTPWTARGDGLVSHLFSDKKMLNVYHPANAAFIVRACNSHQALVDALGKAADTFKDTARACRILHHNVMAEAMEIAEESTRAALALAKEA